MFLLSCRPSQLFPGAIFNLALIAAVSSVLISAPQANAQAIPTQISWSRFGDDLEIAKTRINSGIFLSEISFFRTSLSSLRVEVIRAIDYGSKRLPVADLCRLSRAYLCINANFFDEDGDALGLLVHRGIQIQNIHQGGKTLTGIFEALRDSAAIVNRSEYRPERVLEAIQSGPRILHHGTPVPGVELTSRSRRSGICLDSNRHVLIFIVSSGLLGISMEELQRVLMMPEINCVDALNLDGGGSSQLFLSKNLPGADPNLENISIVGRDSVPVALGLFPRS